MHFDEVTRVQDESGSVAADVKYSQFGGKSHIWVQSSMKVGSILTNGAKSKLGETCSAAGDLSVDPGDFWEILTAGFPWKSQEIRGFPGGILLYMSHR